MATAGKVAEVAEATGAHGRLTTAIQANDDGTWQVGYKAGDEEVVQVKLDGQSGAITETLTGYQVAWPMARGYEGQFGHKLNAPWVWIPLAPCSSSACSTAGGRGGSFTSTCSCCSRSGSRRSTSIAARSASRCRSPIRRSSTCSRGCCGSGSGAATGCGRASPRAGSRSPPIFLIVFRLTLNIADSGVIDVGYAGTVGADRITHGQPIYGEGEFPEDNRFGDTYGPANYYAYVPFELALPWSGSWDELPSSHAAAIAFDLLAVAGLFLFGTRMRPGRAGRDLGVLLAFAWVAYPYTTFALQSNSNDALVAVPVIWALALFARPLARGVLLAIAVATKFAPIVLAPLFATGERGLARPPRRARLAARGAAAGVDLHGRVRARHRAAARPSGDRPRPRGSSSNGPSRASSTGRRRSASGARSTVSSGCRRPSSGSRRRSRRWSRSSPGGARSPRSRRSRQR